ncbi:cytohesin-1-like, partial [Hyposmocoma kahamanoa]|uniref:cytohesin-1-like n=1 Tax=Hyposmocoma kahamanoa TaxID=1477025 RepID=UPI000E6DA0DA
MISEFENLSLGGNNAASNHGDPFSHTELTQEQQKVLIDIRRRKTELLLEIQQLKDELGEVVAELEALDGQEECKQNSKAKQMSIGRKKFNMDPKK